MNRMRRRSVSRIKAMRGGRVTSLDLRRLHLAISPLHYLVHPVDSVRASDPPVNLATKAETLSDRLICPRRVSRRRSAIRRDRSIPTVQAVGVLLAVSVGRLRHR